VTVNIALFDNLDDVAADAAGALDRGAGPSLYGRLSWFRLVHDHCPPPGRLLVVRAGQTWLFLAIERAEARAYGAWYSLRFDAVGRRDEYAMTSIGAALRGQGIARIDLAPVEDPDPLRRGLADAGWTVAVTAKTGNWRIATAGIDFDTYWAARPAQLRNTARRKAKTAGLDLIVHDRFDVGAWADYEAVYRASWKPEEGSFPFLRALAEQESAAGTLRLGLAYKDGRPVAAQLWTIEHGEATIHKLAYAEEAKALSPGTVLGMAMFRRALDQDRVSAIDYGTGDDAYKQDWMAERRTLWRIEAFDPRTARGLAGALKAKAVALVGRGRSG
jgi:hypothetical protein